MNGVIDDCNLNSKTDTGHCHSNVHCTTESHSIPSQLTNCSTTSNGLIFKDASTDKLSAIKSTIHDCMSNSSTNNGECRANVSCQESGHSVPTLIIACSTESNGLIFHDGAQDFQTAQSSVLNDCAQNENTNNSDCRANLRCVGLGSHLHDGFNDLNTFLQVLENSPVNTVLLTN